MLLACVAALSDRASATEQIGTAKVPKDSFIYVCQLIIDGRNGEVVYQIGPPQVNDTVGSCHKVLAGEFLAAGLVIRDGKLASR